MISGLNGWIFLSEARKYRNCLTIELYAFYNYSRIQGAVRREVEWSSLPEQYKQEEARSRLNLDCKC